MTVDLFTQMVTELSQLFLGPPLEKMHGWRRIMLIYLAGVTAGGLAGALAYPRGVHGGASAGVYALITAHFADALFNWDKITNYEILIFMLCGVGNLMDSVIDIYRCWCEKVFEFLEKI